MWLKKLNNNQNMTKTKDLTIKEIMEKNVQVKTDDIEVKKATIKLMEFIASKQKDPKVRAQFLVSRDSTRAAIPKMEEELQYVKDFLATLD